MHVDGGRRVRLLDAHEQYRVQLQRRVRHVAQAQIIEYEVNIFLTTVGVHYGEDDRGAWETSDTRSSIIRGDMVCPLSIDERHSTSREDVRISGRRDVEGLGHSEVVISPSGKHLYDDNDAGNSICSTRGRRRESLRGEEARVRVAQ